MNFPAQGRRIGRHARGQHRRLRGGRRRGVQRRRQRRAAARLSRLREPEPGVRRFEPDQPQRAAQRRDRAHRGRQHARRLRHPAGLGVALDRRRPEAVRQLRLHVVGRRAGIRAHQLRQQAGDRRLLLPATRTRGAACSASTAGRACWWAIGCGPSPASPAPGGARSVPIVDNVPDAAALAAVEADPDCFTLYKPLPGRFHAELRGARRRTCRWSQVCAASPRAASPGT